jgi:hypothetical protein
MFGNNLNVGSLQNLLSFILLSLWTHISTYANVTGRGYHHDREDVDALAAGTANVDEDPMALYLGYFD